MKRFNMPLDVMLFELTPSSVDVRARDGNSGLVSRRPSRRHRGGRMRVARVSNVHSRILKNTSKHSGFTLYFLVPEIRACWFTAVGRHPLLMHISEKSMR